MVFCVLIDHEILKVWVSLIIGKAPIGAAVFPDKQQALDFAAEMAEVLAYEVSEGQTA